MTEPGASGDKDRSSRGMDLAAKKCVPCEGGAALSRDEAEKLLKDVPAWMLWPDASTISRSFKFKDFKSAFAFASRIAELADEEAHHPDLLVSWGRVEVELSTHAVGGLSENDFILAAKIDRIT